MTVLRRSPRCHQVLCLILMLIPILVTSARADLTDDLEALFSEAIPSDVPGLTVIVVRDGETLLHAGYGMADLERGVANGPDMVMRIGSITKQFTATCIMMLVEEGKVALDDPVVKHLPDYPVHDRVITIEHLLTHTSGIKGYTEIPEVMAAAHHEYAVQDVIDTFKDLDLLFEPGTEWSYSNSGYFLLGAVIEAVSGMSYAEFVQTRIFDPLDMTGSYYDSFAQIIPNRALGYHMLEGEYINSPYISMSLPYSAGSLASTVGDLYRWDRAILGDELVSRESRERMWTPYVLGDGEDTGYGYGWMIGEYEGDPVIRHGGGIHGFTSFSMTIPARKLFVASLCNNPGFESDPQSMAQRAAALVCGEPLPIAVEVDPAVLERYVGVYRINDEETRVLTLEDGVLYTQRSGGRKLAASPRSDTEFFYTRSLSRFRIEVDEAGLVVAMHMKPWGGEEEPAVFTDEPIPTGPDVADIDPAVYDRYVGVYEVAPGFNMEVYRDGDRLMTRATGQDEVEVYPSSETEFFLTIVDAQIEFVVDEATGLASSIIIHQAGMEMTGERLE